MSNRLRGQETFVNVLVDGDLRNRIDSVQSFEYTLNLEVQEQDFLGETAPQFDSISKGTSFRMEGQLSNRDFLDFSRQAEDKAARRAGSPVRFDITSTFVFPNGQIYTLLFEDVSVGAIPITTGSREDFTTWTLEGSLSRAREIV